MMFERFTTEARTVVAGAQDEARAMRNPQIGVEHLLSAMLTHDCLSGELLASYRVRSDAVRIYLAAPESDQHGLDRAALASVGIDLTQVWAAAEAQFGPGALQPKANPMPRGHIPFSAQAKEALELAVGAASEMTAPSINSLHLLLGVGDTRLGARLISGIGVDPSRLRTEARLRAGLHAA